jgi:3'-5' exoribonuclease
MGPRLPGDRGPGSYKPKEKALTHNPFAALAAKLEGGAPAAEEPASPSGTDAETPAEAVSPAQEAAPAETRAPEPTASEPAAAEPPAGGTPEPKPGEGA